MKITLKTAIAATVASVALLAAGTAGAAYDPVALHACRMAGMNECLALYGSDPENFSICTETFFANCDALYGIDS